MPRFDTVVLSGTVVVPYLGPRRCDGGKVLGRPSGRYVRRPVGLHPPPA